MSLRAEFVDGVFKPLDGAGDAKPGQVYHVFSEDDLRALADDMYGSHSRI